VQTRERGPPSALVEIVKMQMVPLLMVRQASKIYKKDDLLAYCIKAVSAFV
jgi:hypothetical protein